MTPYRLQDYVRYTRKALINVIGIAGVLAAQGLVPAPWDRWLSAVIAVLAAAIHYAVPNTAKPGTTPAVDPADSVDAFDDDTYLPNGASDDDIRGVDALPAVPATMALDGELGLRMDADAQHMLAAVLELALRAVPPRRDAETAALA